MTLEGIVVLDIVQHFVERWNEIKKRKVSLFWLNEILRLIMNLLCSTEIRRKY